jgi:hypothetical protein
VKRLLVQVACALLACALLLAGAGAGRAEEAPGAAAPDGAVKLRGWFLGAQAAAGGRDHWNVFGRDLLPPAPVADPSGGFGLHFGRRCGARFLLGLQLCVIAHDLEGLNEQLYDLELLFTGTVLFNARGALQPFVRGGFGFGVAATENTEELPDTVAVGTAAIAGAGLQVRLSSRFSLEAEAAANFTNFFEVHTDRDVATGEKDWRVRTSQVGWRVGLGMMIWF